jgi:hypothetical protein
MGPSRKSNKRKNLKLHELEDIADNMHSATCTTSLSTAEKNMTAQYATNLAYTAIIQQLQSYSADTPSDAYLDLACCLDYLEQLFKSTDTKPKDSYSLCQLSHLLFLDGDKAGAKENFNEATALDRTVAEQFRAEQFTPA